MFLFADFESILFSRLIDVDPFSSSRTVWALFKADTYRSGPIIDIAFLFANFDAHILEFTHIQSNGQIIIDLAETNFC